MQRDEGLRQVNLKHEKTVFFFESEMLNVHEISSFMFEVQWDYNYRHEFMLMKMHDCKRKRMFFSLPGDLYLGYTPEN